MTVLMNEPRVRLMIESAHDRGLLAEEELAAVAVDLDLDDEDVETLTTELSDQGVEIVPAGDADEAATAAAVTAAATAAAASVGPTDSLDRYLHEISRHPLLTKEDEQRLAKLGRGASKGDPFEALAVVAAGDAADMAVADDTGLDQPRRSRGNPRRGPAGAVGPGGVERIAQRRRDPAGSK